MKRLNIFLLIIFFTIISFLASYPIITPNDVFIKEDDQYAYYREYRWWGFDSCENKYRKTMYYNGIITNKRFASHLIGGKSKHWETYTYITIDFNNRQYHDTFYEWSYVSTIKHNIGDSVQVKESFYPLHKIQIIYSNK